MPDLRALDAKAQKNYASVVVSQRVQAMNRIADAAASSPRLRQVTLRNPLPLVLNYDERYVGGEPVDDSAYVKQAVPLIYDDYRYDITKVSPVPCLRIALKPNNVGVFGVMDCGAYPLLFVWSAATGLTLTVPKDRELAWRQFDSLYDAEVRESLSLQRDSKDYSVEELSPGIEYVPLFLKSESRSHHAGYYRLDPRTGKREFIKPLGYTPEKPAATKKRLVVPEALTDNGPEALDSDDEHGLEAYNYVRARKPKTTKDVERFAGRFIDDNYEMTDASARKKFANDLVQHLLSTVYTAKKAPVSEDDAEAEAEESGWGERSVNAKPQLPTTYEQKNIPLMVDGKPVRLSVDAEQAAYTYAKRFIFRAGAVLYQDKFKANFEKSLSKMIGQTGVFDYKHFVKAIESEEAKVPIKKAKQVETPETHPHLYVNQDGVNVRMLAATIPTGGFYTGKGKFYGAWVPPVREQDITMNVSKPLKGWKGKTVTNPDEDWYMSWKHPISGKNGYAYLSRKEADISKFHTAAVLGSQLQKISDDVARDIKGKNPKTKAEALCVFLIDQHHFRNGNETFAKLKEGTFGIASLLKKHVTIEGSVVHFEFVGKKQEVWKRSVDFAGMPEALSFVKKCSEGDRNSKLWSGDNWRVTSSDVNGYLRAYDKDGLTVTAKTFRTYHANRYMFHMLTQMGHAAPKYGLSDKDVRKVYKGIAVGSPDAKLLKKKADGVTLQDYLGLDPYKKDSATVYGILPTVASRLGHTTGACRNNYIDPKIVTDFAAKHNWDERTPKEQRTRDDLVVVDAVQKSENGINTMDEDMIDVSQDMLDDL